MSLDDASLATRLFDEPWNAEVRESLRVAGDALESAGDPRGELISLTLAGETRERRIARAELGATIFGSVGALAEAKRSVTLDWRGGRLYAAHLDTRRVRADPAVVVDGFFQSPEIATLRHLWIRASPTAIAALLRALARLASPPPLERLVVISLARPVHATFIANHAASAAIHAAYPDLYLFAAGAHVNAVPLLPGTRFDRRDPAVRADRVLLGRGMLASDAAIRTAALQAIGRLGERAVPFVDLLGLLLEPRVARFDLGPVIACVYALGRHAHALRPALAAITGRPAQFDATTRTAAGVALRDLR